MSSITSTAVGGVITTSQQPKETMHGELSEIYGRLVVVYNMLSDTLRHARGSKLQGQSGSGKSREIHEYHLRQKLYDLNELTGQLEAAAAEIQAEVGMAREEIGAENHDPRTTKSRYVGEIG